MNPLTQEKYYQAKEAYLEELDKINANIDEYAEKAGGVDALDEKQARIFHARRNSLLKMISMHDRAHEYIEELEGWLEQLIADKRALTYQLKDAKSGWQKHFPKLHTESQREHYRHVSRIEAQMKWPELY